MWAIVMVQAALAGETVKEPYDGWSMVVPDGWQHAEAENGAHGMGSEAEGIAVIVAFAPGATLEQVQAEAARGVNEGGVLLIPQGAPVPFAATAGEGVAVDLGAGNGMATGRAVGIVGPRGAVVVLGIAPVASTEGMKKRVDEVGRSVRFFEPEAPKAADQAALDGPMCAWSGGSSYSSTSRMTFDGQGRVGWGSELVGGGQFTDSGGNWTGSWGAVSGNQNATSDIGTYRVEGDRVLVQWGDGSTKSCTIHMRQPDGRVTELKCDGKLWGAGLCG